MAPASATAVTTTPDFARNWTVLMDSRARPAGLSSSAPLHFGHFELRRAERQLLCDGRPVPLGARAFDVLLALIDRPDRVLSKDDLLDAAWPGLVVEEANVQVQVSALRKALGAGAVATIPGRGYRFTTPLDAPGAAAVAAPSPSPSPSPAPARDASDAPQSPMFGRDDDLAALAAALAQHRLITVLGPGGIGKTALARAAAEPVRAGSGLAVVWVDLTPVADARQVAGATAQALRISLRSHDDPLPSLVKALHSTRALLVLDNADQVVDGVAPLARALLAGAPGVRLLVTSQAPLHIDGERVFRLEPLAVPEAGTPAREALGYGAVALFVDQAQAVARRFTLRDDNCDAVVELCRHLDGIALAIKLAAARLPLLGLDGLHARLAERFQLLRSEDRGLPTRQQTLMAALDWSHGLLAPPEQAVFRRLGVFVGGFTLELATAMLREPGQDEWAVIDQIGALVERSLVAADGGDSPRYRLLESAREYALLKLDRAGERHDMQRRHARAVLALFEHSRDTPWRIALQRWGSRHGREIDNLRAALQWAAQHDPVLAVALIGAGSELFHMLGLRQEARRIFAALEPVLQQAGATHGVPRASAARYWLQRSMLFMWGTADTSARAMAIHAIDLLRGLDDPIGLYVALGYASSTTIGEVGESRRMLDEMARIERAEWPFALRHVRVVARVATLELEGRPDAARAVIEAALAEARLAGLEGWVGIDTVFLGANALALGRAEDAVRCSGQLLPAHRAARHPYLLHTLAVQNGGLLLLNRLPEARQVIAEFIEVSRTREWDFLSMQADGCAFLAVLERRPRAGARLLGYADRANRLIGARIAASSYVRAQCGAALAAALAPTVIEALMVEGALLDEEGVCALTLARDDA